MKTISALCLSGLVATVNGWAFIPRRKVKCIAKKSFLVGAAAGVVGAAVVGTATAAGAAIAINQINNNRVVYEPVVGSMNDDVVVITGGTSGLGLETAKRLSAAGASVVLTSRDSEKGKIAVEAVEEYLRSKRIDGGSVYSLVLDLDDLDNVKQFPEQFKALGLGDISVLINNAGVMAIPERELTKDGIERTFQSNHLGHFVLTAGLFPLLSRAGSKVINVSSSAINMAPLGLDVDNLNGEKFYSAWPAYGQSKLANVLFTKELQRRADAAGETWLTTVTLHPGVVNTDLWRYIVGEEKLTEMKSNGSNSIESIAMNVASLFTKTSAEGASTQVFLASENASNLSKGAFYEEMKENRNILRYANDESKAKQLWEISEELGGVIFDVSSGNSDELTTNQVTSNESENDWNESNELEGNDGDNAEDPGNDE
mmetsp:Transcript_21132/g.44384  ORF Transcript_21132/g.44384 Transcript_21132/m.44384 type:complete len:429 (-) Transcript_21132:80-1366(-)